MGFHACGRPDGRRGGPRLRGDGPERIAKAVGDLAIRRAFDQCQPGDIDVPASVGGMVVRPGDVVVGDEDGLPAVFRENRWHRSFVDALESRAVN